jgi:MFS family permease
MITTESSSAAVSWTKARRYYVLGLLSVIGVFSYIDRQVIGILLEPIRRDLKLHDTQMGLIVGAAYAVFYVVGGAPLSRLADRGVRRTLVAICTTVWSLATVFCGFAHSLFQLALGRVGMAVGDAGAVPATQSILADLFPMAERGRAMGVWIGAQSLGIALAMFVGGWLSQTFGWRAAFVIVGLPGVFLALLMRLTVPEPVRGMSEPRGVVAQPRASTLETARFLWRQKSYCAIIFGQALSAVTSFAVYGWFPTFLMRVHHLNALQAGSVMGFGTAVGLVIGSLASGQAADLLGRRDARWRLRIVGLTALLIPPLSAAYLFWPTVGGVLVFFLLSKTVGGCITPPAHAVLLGLAPPHMRASAYFVQALAQNLVGVAIGPLLIGLMNDLMAPRFGQEAIRYSLLISMAGMGLSGVVYLWANRWIPKDLARAEAP